MNKENIEILKKLREDLYNYSIEYNKIDYLKTRYALEEELEFANTLQSNWNSLREWVMQLKNSYMETDNIFDDAKFRILLSILDKMNELEGVDNN